MVQYKVPLLAQEKSMCCWHTSAMMVWMYWQTVSGRQGPMNTLAPVYSGNTGLDPTPQALITLAKTVGMMPLASQASYDAPEVEGLLTHFGPLWCAGYWYGFGHCIVLTGIDSGVLTLNDPDGGVEKTGTLAWFNNKLAKSLAGCTMCKDPQAY